MGSVLSTSAPLPEVTTLLQSADFFNTPTVQPSQSASQTGVNAASWRSQQGGAEKPGDEYESPHEDDYKDDVPCKRKQDVDSEEEDFGISEDSQFLLATAAPTGHNPGVRNMDTEKWNEVGRSTAELESEARISGTPSQTGVGSQEPTINTAPSRAVGASAHPSERTSESGKHSSAHQGKDVDHAAGALLEGVSVSWLVKWCTDAILAKESVESFHPVDSETDRYVFTFGDPYGVNFTLVVILQEQHFFV